MRFFISRSKIRWPGACTRHIHLITLWVRAKKVAPASRPAAALCVVCAVWHSGPDLYGDYVMHHDSGRPFVFQTRREKILRMRFCCIVRRKKASNLLMLRRNKPLKKMCRTKTRRTFIFTLLPVCISESKIVIDSYENSLLKIQPLLLFYSMS